MKNLEILVGVIRAFFIRAISFGRFCFVFPIKLCSGSVIYTDKSSTIILGKHVSINYHSHLAAVKGGHIAVGSYSGIGDNNMIISHDNITIGDNVMIGPNVCIYDHDHNFKESGIMRNMGYVTAPVIIEDNVWIGAGAVILKGVTIGSGSVIAAGTIVNESIPPNSICRDKRQKFIVDRY